MIVIGVFVLAIVVAGAQTLFNRGNLALTTSFAGQGISFSASKTAVFSGEKVTLSWNVPNARTDISGAVVLFNSLNPTKKEVSANGNSTVVVERPTTFYITAKLKGGGVTTEKLTVNIYSDQNAIFEVTQNQGPDNYLSEVTITKGQAATLRWDTFKVTSASIDQGVGSVHLPQGRKEIRPTVDTVYKLSFVTSTGTSAFKTVTVKVVDLEIEKFSADKTTILGKTATLSWKVNGSFDSLKIYPSVGSAITLQSASGSKVVTLPEGVDTVTYELRAVKGNVTVTTDPGNNITITNSSVRIDSFTTDKASYIKGGVIVFSWATSGADTVVIQKVVDGIPTTILSGLPKDGTKRYTAVDAGQLSYRLLAKKGSVEKEAFIAVTVQTLVFNASDLAIVSGSPVTLSWNADGADHVTLTSVTGNLPAKGTKTLKPTSTTTYVLTALDKSEQTIGSGSITVIVSMLEATFEANKFTVAKGGSVRFTWTTKNATNVTFQQGSATPQTVALNGSKTVTFQTAGEYIFTLNVSKVPPVGKGPAIVLPPKVLTITVQ